MIDNVLHCPADGSNDALTNGKSSNVETKGKADRVNDDSLCWMIVEAAEGIINVDLVVNRMDVLCNRSGENL